MKNQNHVILFGKKLTKEDILEATSAFLDVIMSKEDAENELTKTDEGAKKENNETMVEEVLTKLGLSSTLEGTKYIKESIVYYMAHHDTVNIKKDIYPMLNSKYGVSYDRLRECMREAIKIAFYREPTQLAKDLFNVSEGEKNKRVSSKSFIIRVLDYCEYYSITKWNIEKVE